MKKIAKTLLMVLLVLVVATSCGKDEEEPIGSPVFRVSILGK